MTIGYMVLIIAFIWKEKNTARDKLYEKVDGNLGYDYEAEGNSEYVGFIFNMTSKNITNFIGKNAYTLDKVILTDIYGKLILESIYSGFIMNCPD